MSAVVARSHLIRVGAELVHLESVQTAPLRYATSAMRLASSRWGSLMSSYQALYARAAIGRE